MPRPQEQGLGEDLCIEPRCGSANTKIVACRRYAMYRILRGVSTKKSCANSWNDCHSRVEVSRQQAQEKKTAGISCTRFSNWQLAAWLQAGEDRAIAAGSKAD
jgi:hypothetical protein